MTLLTLPFRLALALFLIALITPFLILFGIFKPKQAQEDLKYLFLDGWGFVKDGFKKKDGDIFS